MDQIFLWGLVALVVLVTLAWALAHRARHPRRTLATYDEPRPPDERSRTGGT